MKISHTVMVVLTMSLGAGVARGDDAKPIPTWDAGAERDAKAGKLKEGVLKLSMEGIRRVQQALVARSHVIKDLDGTINKETEAALTKLQNMSKLKETGAITIETLHALGFGLAVMIATDAKSAEVARGEMDRSTGETTVVKAGMPVDVHVCGKGDSEPIGFVVIGKSQLEAIQKRLAKENLYSGAADGHVTPALIVGIRSFQTAKAHKTKSLLDIQTLVLIPEVEIEVVVTEKLDPAGSRIDPDAPPRK